VGGAVSNARQRRGKKTEHVVAEYLKQRGWPFALAVGSGRGGTDITGTPDIAPEVKARGDFNPVGWVKQAEKNADGRLPFAVYRPNGVGERPDRYLAILRLADLVELLRTSGYGDGKDR